MKSNKELGIRDDDYENPLWNPYEEVVHVTTGHPILDKCDIESLKKCATKSLDKKMNPCTVMRYEVPFKSLSEAEQVKLIESMRNVYRLGYHDLNCDDSDDYAFT